MYQAGNSRRTMRLDLVRSIRSHVLEMNLAGPAEFDELEAKARAHLENPHTVVISRLAVPDLGPTTRLRIGMIGP
jgi:hypothetical protein